MSILDSVKFFAGQALFEIGGIVVFIIAISVFVWWLKK